jgi:hypothetical protein
MDENPRQTDSDDDHETEHDAPRHQYLPAVAAILVVGSGLWLVNAIGGLRKAQLSAPLQSNRCAAATAGLEQTN